MFAHTHPRITTGVAVRARAPPAVSTSPDKAARGAPHTLNEVNSQLSRRMPILASQTVNTFLNKSFLLRARPPRRHASCYCPDFVPVSGNYPLLCALSFGPRLGKLQKASTNRANPFPTPHQTLAPAPFRLPSDFNRVILLSAATAIDDFFQGTLRFRIPRPSPSPFLSLYLPPWRRVPRRRASFFTFFLLYGETVSYR